MPVAEASILGAHADVGQQRHHQAGPDGHPVDRRDDGLLAVDQVVHHVAHLAEHARHPLVVADLAGHHGQVAAGREGLARAGDHHGPGLLVPGDVGPDPGQLAVHRLVGGVIHFGPVHRDQQDAVRTALEEQAIVAAVVHASRD
jgi:hypothetical protein